MENTEEVYTYKFEGDIDIESSERIYNDLKSIIIVHKDLILDFSNVNLITSPGIQILMSLRNYMKNNNHNLTITNLLQNTSDMITEFGVDKTILIKG